MKINELIEKLNGKACHIADADIDISGGYAGDFLSVVMAKLPEGAAWFTIMTNVNVSAVASLTAASVIVICEGFEPDAQLMAKAVANDINIIRTDLDVFSAVRAF